MGHAWAATRHWVVNPACFFHHVAPVTSGERLAAARWMQSMLHDPLRRERMVDLAVLALLLQPKGKNVPAADLDVDD